jgi:triosephosphate isomerase
VRNGVATWRDVDVAVAPSFLAVHAVARRLEGGPVAVAAQNCFWEDKGAFTGEVSAPQLAEAGCRYVIVGHSERRQLMGELDAAVNLKARAALRAGVTPIICVGETLAERDAGETLGRIQSQLEAAIKDISDADLGRTLIAYEPVWAIGTGRNATPAQAEEVHRFIRGRIGTRSAAVAAAVRILYGGSMKPDNVAALLAQENVDGGLVGGASLSAPSFIQIVQAAHGAPAAS